MRTLRIVLVGAGLRGKDAYGRWVARHPDQAKIVAVAEPDATRRLAVGREHGLGSEVLFPGWPELLAARVPADLCLVATGDTQHLEPALAALEAGYDLLVEKPMATTPQDCRRLVAAADRLGRSLRVCHVLRHTDFFQAVKKTLETGVLGKVVHIAHAENVSWYHFAHSFVRGNWHREDQSSPLVLAKTCHDLDLLCWLAGQGPDKVHSFGSRSFFREEQAPAGAPARCSDGCPHSPTCLWYAPRLYRRGEDLLTIPRRSGNPLLSWASQAAVTAARWASPRYQWKDWPTTAVTGDLTAEGVDRALREGPYGRCVFRCDNDVVDHQVVSLEFPDGLTATMTVHGLSDKEGRTLKIEGSEATLVGDFAAAGERLEVRNHRTGKTTVLHQKGFSARGHGGGDAGLMAAVAAAYGEASGKDPLTTGRAALESHLLAFAAEVSRRENRVLGRKEWYP